ncbi:hypothetical protein SAMN05216266_102136 [Amycolatopsis marina]|uniref:Uncharacterized protein n=1 Tax=Amycolatopsis marina TaxID=490629 RepID=A0A1I0WS50_9PSEU|nr:hypothetical protein [Amycolatopsis marina]SFA90990.1 hypothetical protein SAMN05216266_102136 [Amycolatopsis marina]
MTTTPYEVREVRELAERMLTLARAKDLSTLAVLIGRLVGKYAPQRHLLRPLLLELVGHTVEAIPAQRGTHPREVFVADLSDDQGAGVEVDEVDPALRAMLRAVLAALNGAPADVVDQVDLVVGDRDPVAKSNAVVHGLLWIDQLTHGSTGRTLTVSPDLR